MKTYRRGLDDGSGLDNLLLVHLGTGTVKVTDDGGHTGLVAHGGSQVDGLLGVILGEAIRRKKLSVLGSPHILKRKFSQFQGCKNAPLNLTAVAGSALARQVGQRACVGRVSKIAH